jgi:hypothetical protein
MVRKKQPNPPKEVKKRGPKRIFTEQDLHAVEMLTKLGATDKQIAMFFKVTTSAVEVWNKRYPDYVEARKRGGIEADMKVVQSLYKRAIGYSYIEEEYSAIEMDGAPIPMSQMRKVKRVKKRLPPDVKAAIKWLQVRQKETWTIVPEMIHKHSGSVNHLHRKIQEIPIQELSEQTQQMVFELTQKQLAIPISTSDN